VKLYALAINGMMFYFVGDIPVPLLSEVDKIAKETHVDANYQTYCHNFVIAVKEKLKIELCQKILSTFLENRNTFRMIRRFRKYNGSV